MEDLLQQNDQQQIQCFCKNRKVNIQPYEKEQFKKCQQCKIMQIHNYCSFPQYIPSEILCYQCRIKISEPYYKIEMFYMKPFLMKYIEIGEEKDNEKIELIFKNNYQSKLNDLIKNIKDNKCHLLVYCMNIQPPRKLKNESKEINIEEDENFIEPPLFEWPNDNIGVKFNEGFYSYQFQNMIQIPGKEINFNLINKLEIRYDPKNIQSNSIIQFVIGTPKEPLVILKDLVKNNTPQFDKMKQKFIDNQWHTDDNIIQEKIDSNVRILDPITQKIINIPARGKNCKHFQCFDLSVYVQSQIKQSNNDFRRWICPVCQDLLYLKDIETDPIFFENILEIKQKLPYNILNKLEYINFDNDLKYVLPDDIQLCIDNQIEEEQEDLLQNQEITNLVTTEKEMKQIVSEQKTAFRNLYNQKLNEKNSKKSTTDIHKLETRAYRETFEELVKKDKSFQNINIFQASCFFINITKDKYFDSQQHTKQNAVFQNQIDLTLNSHITQVFKKVYKAYYNYILTNFSLQFFDDIESIIIMNIYMLSQNKTQIQNIQPILEYFVAFSDLLFEDSEIQKRYGFPGKCQGQLGLYLGLFVKGFCVITEKKSKEDIIFIINFYRQYMSTLILPPKDSDKQNQQISIQFIAQIMDLFVCEEDHTDIDDYVEMLQFIYSPPQFKITTPKEIGIIKNFLKLIKAIININYGKKSIFQLEQQDIDIKFKQIIQDYDEGFIPSEFLSDKIMDDFILD